MDKKKVVVVGAGPGGLALAMLLQNKGYNVEIYEQNDYVGGRNGSFMLGDYKFDIGPTFFLMKNVLEEIFEKTGKKLSDYVKLIEIDPMYRLVFGGGKKEFYPSRDKAKMKEEMERISPGSFVGYEKYLEKEKKKYDQLIPCLQIPYSSIKDLFTKQFLTSLPVLDAHVSLYDVLGRYFNDEELKLSFTFQAKYIGMSPWSAPGTFSIISYIEHGGGIYHVEGGLNMLSQAMAKAFQEDGGVIHLGKKVKNIIIEDKKAKGALLESGEEVRGDYTVINADFAHAMTNIVKKEDRKKYTDEKLREKKYSCSTLMFYFGVDKVYEDIPHHSIIFADEYKKNVDDITIRKTLSNDISFYVQNASVTDKTLAPEGKSTIYVLVPVPNLKGSFKCEDQENCLRNEVLDLLEQRGGFENLREHIVEEKTITPRGWEDDYSVYLGATFNLGHNISQMLLFRPHNEFEEFKNCYLVGGGTHPGSGLPTIYESGRISADLIMKRDGKK